MVAFVQPPEKKAYRKRLAGVCVCGAAKDIKSKRCIGCTAASRLSKKMARRAIPDCCGCRGAQLPSPWHCACGRWKTSTAVVCDACQQTLEAADWALSRVSGRLSNGFSGTYEDLGDVELPPDEDAEARRQIAQADACPE